MTPESFFSLSNPIVFSALILFALLAVIFIYYRYIITPMRRRFQSEKKMLKREHKSLMATFAELDPEPIFRIDKTGTILMANEAGLGLNTNGILIGKNIKDIIPEIDSLNVEEHILKGLQANISSTIMNKYYKFTLKGIPALKIGQLYGSDVTDLKTTEDHLTHALSRAEESDKIKSHFLAQMSHEIRSPLTAILGFSAMIEEEMQNKLPAEFEFAFNAIENSGKRLKRTIDQLLNMSQLQTSRYEPEPVLVKLDLLLDQIIKDHASQAAEKNLYIHFNNNCKNLELHTDGYAVQQILVNVIDNAVKYTKSGGITVNLEIKNELAFVTISDTGIGISNEYLEKLFTPFSQEIMGYNRPYEGNGLGLALIKRFAEVIDAEISVESEKDKGTIFKIYFKVGK